MCQLCIIKYSRDEAYVRALEAHTEWTLRPCPSRERQMAVRPPVDIFTGYFSDSERIGFTMLFFFFLSTEIRLVQFLRSSNVPPPPIDDWGVRTCTGTVYYLEAFFEIFSNFL